LELVMSGQIVSFPLITWLMVIGGVGILLAAQWWLIRWLEAGAPVRNLKLGRKFALLTFVALLATNAIHIWAAAHAYQPVTTVKRCLPQCHPATADKFMRKRGWVDEEAWERQNALTFKRKNDLNYPRAPRHTQPVDKPVNIMLLVV